MQYQVQPRATNTLAARLGRGATFLIASTVMSAASAALPPFTFAPSGVGLTGTAFTADNILISDYSSVNLTGSTFSETGYLTVSGFQLGGSTFTPTGLNSTYGMYIAFSGNGTTTTGNPAATPTFGSFSSLTFSLYGYNGSASFGFSGTTPTESASGEVLLASGSLKNGSVVTVPTGDGSTFTPSANATLSFLVNPAAAAFFAAPTTFFNLSQTAFTNTTSEVEPFSNGFLIRQGGGSLNFVTAVPEPETYALMWAGLGAVGFMMRRRKAA